MDERIMKSVATRLGMTVDEYRKHRDAGELWCSGCRRWHAADEFASTKGGYCRAAELKRTRGHRMHRDQEFLNHLRARLLVK